MSYHSMFGAKLATCIPRILHCLVLIILYACLLGGPCLILLSIRVFGGVVSFKRIFVFR